MLAGVPTAGVSGRGLARKPAVRLPSPALDHGAVQPVL